MKDPLVAVMISGCGRNLATPTDPRDAEIERLRGACQPVLIGGNHLATIIGPDHPPVTATHDQAMAWYGNSDAYEAWCCWRTIMELRTALELPARAALKEGDGG